MPFDVKTDAAKRKRYQLRRRYARGGPGMHQQTNERAALRSADLEAHQRSQEIEQLQVYEELDNGPVPYG